jgi:hypothetical protein
MLPCCTTRSLPECQGRSHEARAGNGPLVFLEVQHSDYFAEDDIVRQDDEYGCLPVERSSRNQKRVASPSLSRPSLCPSCAGI